MATPIDQSEFVDEDFESAGPTQGNVVRDVAGLQSEAELDDRVAQTHEKIEALRRAQEKLERERSALEEARRRRHELESGHEEMLMKLTRGVGILEEAQLKHRQDAEQMSKSLNDLRKCLDQIKRIDWQTWNDENWSEELSKSLTAIENARNELNASIIKWPLLSSESPARQAEPRTPKSQVRGLADLNFMECTRIGLAFTWPLLLLGLVSIVLTVFYWFGT